MKLINQQKEFNYYCKYLQDQSIIFMDTEFYRQKTYSTKLSIVQIATKKNDRIILDMLVIKDYSIFKDLLINKKILKVFHASDQDFNIFYNLFGILPNNTFDTQIAASVIGMNNIIGYASLCKKMLNINLDKTLQKANWLQRPLSKHLLDYAIKDVNYLIPLYNSLSNIMNKRKLWNMYYIKSKKSFNMSTYKLSPKRLLKKFRSLSNKSSRFQDILMNFLILREKCAVINNIPRTFCASDEELIRLCEVLPINNLELSTINIYGKALVSNNFKKELFNLCKILK